MSERWFSCRTIYIHQSSHFHTRNEASAIMSTTELPISLSETTAGRKNDCFWYDVENANDDVIAKPETVVLAASLGLLIFLTVSGNVLVCATIIANKKLHTVTNCFLLSLATTDLLLGAAVMPLSAVATVSGRRWPFGPIVCNLYTSGDVMLCTVSILTLFAISIDRYVAVTSPLWYQVSAADEVAWSRRARSDTCSVIAWCMYLWHDLWTAVQFGCKPT